MKQHTQGFYNFADGAVIWFYGLREVEKEIEIVKHGAVVKFVPTYF